MCKRWSRKRSLFSSTAAEEGSSRRSGPTLACTSLDSRELECLHSWRRPLLCLSHPSTDTTTSSDTSWMWSRAEDCGSWWGEGLGGLGWEKEIKTHLTKLTVCFLFYWLNATNEFLHKFDTKEININQNYFPLNTFQSSTLKRLNVTGCTCEWVFTQRACSGHCGTN